MPSPRRLALVAALLVFFDQWSKSWAVNALDDGRTIDVVWTLRFALGFNSGIAFSQAPVSYTHLTLPTNREV